MILRSKLFQIAVGVLAFIAILGVLRFKPWQQRAGSSQAATRTDESGRQELQVGFLPVT
jgi:hypothetical protein